MSSGGLSERRRGLGRRRRWGRLSVEERKWWQEEVKRPLEEKKGEEQRAREDEERMRQEPECAKDIQWEEAMGLWQSRRRRLEGRGRLRG